MGYRIINGKVWILRWTWSRHSITTSGSHDNYFLGLSPLVHSDYWPRLEFNRMANAHAQSWWEGFSFIRAWGTSWDTALTHVLCSAGAKYSSQRQRGAEGEALPGTVGHVWALGSASSMIELREVRKCTWKHHTNSLCSNSLFALLLWVASHPPGRSQGHQQDEDVLLLPRQ